MSTQQMPGLETFGECVVKSTLDLRKLYNFRTIEGLEKVPKPQVTEGDQSVQFKSGTEKRRETSHSTPKLSCGEGQRQWTGIENRTTDHF